MVKTFGPVEDNVLQQIEACQAVEEGSVAVLCADNHLGYSMPIGGVIGYEGLVSPSAVGYDIACGNCAIKTDLKASEIDREKVMDDIWKSLSFGIGRKNNEKVEHAILDEIAETEHPFQRQLTDLAAQQLGTIGSGNHYVDLFEDELGTLWVGVHFGSRGFGYRTCEWALGLAGSTSNDMFSPPVTFGLASEQGILYLDGMRRAGRYAYGGREWVVKKVAALLGANVLDVVHNHHNFAWTESHGGHELVVHRKGATPAFPAQRGFVGGTMAEGGVIIRGVEDTLSQAALYSTVHGAGRVMSRTKAAGKTKVVRQWTCGQRGCAHHTSGFPANAHRRGKDNSLPLCPACGSKLHLRSESICVKPGLIDFEEVKRDMKAKGIALRGAGADEAPMAYKRLPEVLAYHAGTIEIEHYLTPIGVAMAGADTHDPFKD